MPPEISPETGGAGSRAQTEPQLDLGVRSEHSTIAAEGQVGG